MANVSYKFDEIYDKLRKQNNLCIFVKAFSERTDLSRNMSDFIFWICILGKKEKLSRIMLKSHFFCILTVDTLLPALS